MAMVQESKKRHPLINNQERNEYVGTFEASAKVKVSGRNIVERLNN